MKLHYASFFIRCKGLLNILMPFSRTIRNIENLHNKPCSFTAWKSLGRLQPRFVKETDTGSCTTESRVVRRNPARMPLWNACGRFGVVAGVERLGNTGLTNTGQLLVYRWGGEVALVAEKLETPACSEEKRPWQCHLWADSLLLPAEMAESHRLLFPISFIFCQKTEISGILLNCNQLIVNTFIFVELILHES